jgi:copper transport protein
VAPLVARYSWLAGWSVAAVALTGVVMGALILGDLSALISSTFGRLLLVKIALVVGLVAAGAYNRNVLLPELEAGTDDGWAIGRLRTSLSIELVLFVAVVVLTAVLVNANPN